MKHDFRSAKNDFQIVESCLVQVDNLIMMQNTNLGDVTQIIILVIAVLLTALVLYVATRLIA